MINNTSIQTQRYLPIEVSGQVFAIPMPDVVAVHQLHDNEEEHNPAQTGQDSKGSMSVIDLQRLFGTTSDSERGTQVVVISTQIGTCAVLVDAVRPARTADPGDYHPLPQLVIPMGCPFSGVLREPDTLVLIINTQQLIEQLHQVAPELIAGGNYAT